MPDDPHEPSGTGLTGAQRQELDRRLAEDDADPENVVRWAEVKARLTARLAAARQRKHKA